MAISPRHTSAPSPIILLCIVLLISHAASPFSAVSPPSASSLKASEAEITKRRNIAIISHPDSGKTTMTGRAGRRAVQCHEMTNNLSLVASLHAPSSGPFPSPFLEKLLLHGGAIQQAGAVRQKGEQRRTASDFMQMEQDRGISISATAMSFDYGEHKINVLDTPGHQDFSEDTYRALAAADNALMLVDAAKGLEPQTRKLFEVCRMRGLPIFSFCNKLDRPALDPTEIMDQIEAEFGLETHPIVWPIGDGDRFKGLLDRVTNEVILYDKAEKRGQMSTLNRIPFDDKDAVKSAIGDDELYDKLLEDQELLEGLLPPLDRGRVLAGNQVRTDEGGLERSDSKIIILLFHISNNPFHAHFARAAVSPLFWICHFRLWRRSLSGVFCRLRFRPSHQNGCL